MLFFALLPGLVLTSLTIDLNGCLALNNEESTMLAMSVEILLPPKGNHPLSATFGFLQQEMGIEWKVLQKWLSKRCMNVEWRRLFLDEVINYWLDFPFESVLFDAADLTTEQYEQLRHLDWPHLKAFVASLKPNEQFLEWLWGEHFFDMIVNRDLGLVAIPGWTGRDVALEKLFMAESQLLALLNGEADLTSVDSKGVILFLQSLLRYSGSLSRSQQQRLFSYLLANNIPLEDSDAGPFMLLFENIMGDYVLPDGIRLTAKTVAHLVSSTEQSWKHPFWLRMVGKINLEVLMDPDWFQLVYQCPPNGKEILRFRIFPFLIFRSAELEMAGQQQAGLSRVNLRYTGQFYVHLSIPELRFSPLYQEYWNAGIRSLLGEAIREMIRNSTGADAIEQAFFALTTLYREPFLDFECLGRLAAAGLLRQVPKQSLLFMNWHTEPVHGLLVERLAEFIEGNLDALPSWLDLFEKMPPAWLSALTLKLHQRQTLVHFDVLHSRYQPEVTMRTMSLLFKYSLPHLLVSNALAWWIELDLEPWAWNDLPMLITSKISEIPNGNLLLAMRYYGDMAMLMKPAEGNKQTYGRVAMRLLATASSDRRLVEQLLHVVNVSALEPEDQEGFMVWLQEKIQDMKNELELVDFERISDWILENCPSQLVELLINSFITLPFFASDEFLTLLSEIKTGDMPSLRMLLGYGLPYLIRQSASVFALWTSNIGENHDALWRNLPKAIMEDLDSIPTDNLILAAKGYSDYEGLLGQLRPPIYGSFVNLLLDQLIKRDDRESAQLFCAAVDLSMPSPSQLELYRTLLRHL